MLDNLATLDPTPPVNAPWWKSQTGIGSVILAFGVALQVIPGVPPWISAALIAVGSILAGKGLRDASIRNGPNPQ